MGSVADGDDGLEGLDGLEDFALDDLDDLDVEPELVGHGVPGPALPPGAVVERRPEPGVTWTFADRRIEGVTFRGLREAQEWLDFRRCELVDCTFDDSELSCRWGGVDRRQQDASRFVRCRFVGCAMVAFDPAYGRLEGCTFTDCDWETTFLDTVDLVGNAFTGLVSGLTIWGQDLRLAGVLRPRPAPNEIHGNDFRGADLRGLGLRAEVPVHQQLWPQGPTCAVVDRIRRRVDVVAEQTGPDGPAPDPRLHDEALWWISLQDAQSHQDDTWVRWDDPVMPEGYNRLMRAVAAVQLPPTG